MIRKFSLFAIYSIVLVAITVSLTAKPETVQPEKPQLTAGQAIQLLEKDFRENPDVHIAALKEALDASTHLEDVLLEHDLCQLAKTGEQTLQDNQKLLSSTRVLLISMKKARADLGCTCEEACGCTLPCNCSSEESTQKKQNERKRRVLNFLFGTSLEVQGEPAKACPSCGGSGGTCDLPPLTLKEVEEAGLVPLPPIEN